MYRSHNKKIKIYGQKAAYEVFLIAENAQHIVSKAAHHSHQVTLLEVMALASSAYYVEASIYEHPEQPVLVYGLVIFREKYYQVVGYTTELYGGRFILETCRVVSDVTLQAVCAAKRDSLTTVEISPNGKITRHRNQREA